MSSSLRMDVYVKWLFFIILVFPCTGNPVNKMDQMRTSVTKCPAGYLHHSDSYYKFYHELLSWPESITFCKGLGEHLVKMESREEFNYLRTQANSQLGSFPGGGFWIGATDAMEEGTWQWIEPLSPMTRDQVIWVRNEPSNLTREDCATLWHTGYDHLIGDYFCSAKLYVICEKEICNFCPRSFHPMNNMHLRMVVGLLLGIVHVAVSSKCPQGWTEFSSSCYFLSKSAASWLDATTMCKALNDSHLVNVDGSSEQNDLIVFTRALGLKSSVWLGGTDVVQEGHWLWANTLQPLTFNNFAHIDNVDASQNCLAMDVHQHFEWHDRDCTNKYQYICELPIRANLVWVTISPALQPIGK